jgi:hypothetical protein
MMWSGVTDFLIDTAGSALADSNATGAPAFFSAECTSLINVGRSLVGTELLLT